MGKKFIFNKNKKRELGDNDYLIKAGLRYKMVTPLERLKKSHKEIETLKKVKKLQNNKNKMTTLVKTHCNG